MRSPGPTRFLAATAIVFWALALPAQRYYGRDHHVYHAPAQTKHPAAQATKAHATSTTVANGAAHNANAASTQSIPDHAGSLVPKPDAMPPVNPTERRPQ